MSSLVSDDEDDTHESKAAKAKEYMKLFKRNCEGMRSYYGQNEVTWTQVEEFKNSEVLSGLVEENYVGVSHVSLLDYHEPENKRYWVVYMNTHTQKCKYMDYEEAVRKCPVWLAFWINLHGYSTVYDVWMWCANEKTLPLAKTSKN